MMLCETITLFGWSLIERVIWTIHQWVLTKHGHLDLSYLNILVVGVVMSFAEEFW